MTLKLLLKKHTGKLDPNELDLLMAQALHKSKEYIYKNPKTNIRRSSGDALKKLVKKRIAGTPIAYLRRSQEFFGLNFLINKYTLIPRPDSELIVEEALKFLKNKKNQKIIDIGTGSGCLILSIAKRLRPDGSLGDPSGQFWATDISGRALKVARTNARKLKIKNAIKFYKSDLLKNIPQNKFDLVIANLPYLTHEQLKEPSIKKEPKNALLSGPQGLDHYTRLLAQLPKFLAKKYLILLEIDPDQKDKITKIIEKNLPSGKISFLKDLAGNTRVVKINA